MKIKAKAVNDRIELMLNLAKGCKIKKVPKNQRIYPKYDEALHITMHGEPISDSRPRHVKKTDLFYNPHKAMLMKVFGKLYEKDPLLKKTTIKTPHGIVIRNYLKPDKEIKNSFGKEILSDEVLAIKQKDNDNIEKVHWDVLQDIKYAVILDDKLVTHNYSSKYYSVDPRIELEIHYPSEEMLKLEKVTFNRYNDIIERGANYKKYKITPKYIFDIMKTPRERFPEVFFNNLSQVSIPHKQIISILDTCYAAQDIADLTVYCNGKPSNRISNMVHLSESIQSETYRVTNTKRRVLK